MPVTEDGLGSLNDFEEYFFFEFAFALEEISHEDPVDGLAGEDVVMGDRLLVGRGGAFDDAITQGVLKFCH